MADLNYQNITNTDEGGQVVTEGFSAEVLQMVTLNYIEVKGNKCQEVVY